MGIVVRQFVIAFSRRLVSGRETQEMQGRTGVCTCPSLSTSSSWCFIIKRSGFGVSVVTSLSLSREVLICFSVFERDSIACNRRSSSSVCRTFRI